MTKHTAPLAGFTPPHLLSGMAADTPILVALSGGADSVALLSLLAEYARATGAPLSVAHVDHMLRGADSDADRTFCEALAAKYGLPFYLRRVDVKQLANEHHRGIEEEARIVRYQFFEEIMKNHGIPLLATAHHADDNAETVLLNLSRGSGLRGMCGIPPIRPLGDGKLIRPLLGASKAEILAYCEENSLSYVIDKTNEDTDFVRNRIRHRVLPELKAVNAGAVESITRLCRTAAREDDFLALCAREFLEKHRTDDGGIPTAALNEAHPALAARAIMALLTTQGLEIAAIHVDAILALAQKATPHTSLDVGCSLTARIENGQLYLSSARIEAVPSDYCIPLREGVTEIPEADAAILIEVCDGSQKNQKSFKNIYKKETTTHISSDKISGVLIARPRREGDVILCGGMHKKVKKLMCDAKLPLSLRARLPLLCDDAGILWIPNVIQRDGCKGNTITITLYYND